MHEYQPRFYRHWVKDKDLVSFSVVLEESDLYVRARRNLRRKTLKVLMRHRASLEGYIERCPEFLTSLEPVAVGEDAPPIVRAMAEAADKVDVGPMAAVAGAIAEYVGKELLPFSREVIVENGGDIFLKIMKSRSIGVYAGESSPFTGKIGLEISPEETPLGICTSSGTVGHSLSFGSADACIVLSRSTPLADAAATAIGNLIGYADDIPRGIDFARSVEGVRGVLILKDDRIGIWGDVKIVTVGG
ncbi:MAG: thiamine biosynthesis protein ApbE [Chloroflexi bacterium RBG_13_53_26]|nr:MAG: thiamine biosynthesis protein ApbE [Chloroflexi bacterium RBG_13_53_26]